MPEAVLSLRLWPEDLVEFSYKGLADLLPQAKTIKLGTWLLRFFEC